MLHVTIMAGGSGTRFWPASRRHVPKQFLRLAADASMLAETVQRLEGLCEPEQITVFTNAVLADLTRQELNNTRIRVVGEPAKRDTAPCIALAAAMALHRDPQAVLITLPADQVIQPVAPFQSALRQALDIVADDGKQIVMLGIRPTYPAEVYGYIERGEQLPGRELPTYRVRQFREKPTAEVATEFLRQGTFYWNAGIFVARAETLVGALRTFEPDLMCTIAAIAERTDDPSFAATLAERFPGVTAKSIDYAVMERYPQVSVIEATFEWDDVGNWLALERMRSQDVDGNTVDAERFLGLNTTGSIIRAAGGHLVVTLGVQDLIVVHTPDATLVANKRDESALRQIVEQLEIRGWTDVL